MFRGVVRCVCILKCVHDFKELKGNSIIKLMIDKQMRNDILSISESMTKVLWDNN